LTIIILCLCMAGAGICQKSSDLKHVKTTYEYTSADASLTPMEVLDKAFEEARRHAMVEEFGMDVSGMNSVVQHSKSKDGKTTATTDHVSVSETSVRGEWVKTEKEEVKEEPTFKDGFWHAKVLVEGYARKSSGTKADIKYAFVKHPQDELPVSVYENEAQIYLRFSSPVNGSLCVYLVEENEAFCLLPYQKQKTGSYAIEAGREYLFFCEDCKGADPQTEEYKMTCTGEDVQDFLYLIFTPNSVSKANDSDGGKNMFGDNMPRALSAKDLIQWIERNKTKDPDLDVRKEIITVKCN